MELEFFGLGELAEADTDTAELVASHILALLQEILSENI